MPTPRLLSEFAKQVRSRGLSSLRWSTDEGAGGNAWVSGVVVSSEGELSPNYRVDLESGSGVAGAAAVSVIEGVAVGNWVWLVPGPGGGYLIVALQ